MLASRPSFADKPSFGEKAVESGLDGETSSNVDRSDAYISQQLNDLFANEIVPAKKKR